MGHLLFLFVLFFCKMVLANWQVVFVPKTIVTKPKVKLEINLDNTYKGRIPICEESGIEQIRSLNSPYEEFWAFIPGSCVWIELGIMEKIGSSIRRDKYGRCKAPNVISGVKKNDIIRLIREVDNLTLYHPHPTNKKLVDHLIKSGNSQGLSQHCLGEAQVETLESILPGTHDLASMFLFSEQFYKIKNQGKLVEKIVSFYGVTEYGLNHKGKSMVAEDDYFRLVRRALIAYLALRKRIGIESYKDEGAANRGKKTRLLLSKINKEADIFYIKFVPFQAITPAK